MNPTFRVPDVLQVEPCTAESIRRGDVIVYRDPSSRGNVVHRVVSVLEDGDLRTQGDANDLLDPCVVRSSDVIGRVAYATRNGKRRKVRGGFLGRVVGASARFYGVARIRVMRLLRPLYIAWSGCFAFPWLVKRLNLRIVHYSRQGKISELHLLMGNRCIGRLLPDQPGWHITPPFRLVVDETSLPRKILTD